MEKKFLFLFLILLALPSKAQFTNFRLSSEVLIENAVKGAFYIAESSYYIADANGKKYGRGGKTYFNKVKTLACKTDAGYVMAADALEPWKSDPVYDKYRNNANYIPILTDTIEFSNLENKAKQIVSINDNISLFDNKLMLTVKDNTNADGLSISTDNSDFTWLVIVKSNSEGEYNLILIKESLDLTKDNPEPLNNPILDNNVLGGIYISANVINVGMVDFSISGFMVKEGRKWKVLPVNESLKNNENETPEQEVTIGVTVVEEPSDELTPVNNSEISE